MFWFSNNTKSIYYLMPIFAGANYIIPELLNKWHSFWTIFYIYNNIYPRQIIIGLIQMAKIKYLWDPKNIGLIFISVQYFQRATWAFSWTFLEQFLFGSFPKIILRVSQVLISKLTKNHTESQNHFNIWKLLSHP